MHQRRKPLLILLSITVAYMFVQNLTGISVAALFDLPANAFLIPFFLANF